MDGIKALLDGAGSRDSSDNSVPADIIATRPDTCEKHGEYVAQQIRLRLERNVLVPYWLPCPLCREEWELVQKSEVKCFAGYIPGEPTWRLR